MEDLFWRAAYLQKMRKIATTDFPTKEGVREIRRESGSGASRLSFRATLSKGEDCVCF